MVIQAGTIQRHVLSLFTASLTLVSPDALAGPHSTNWITEIYGGRYYDDSRIGAYLVTATDKGDGPNLIGEVLHEVYPAYRFSGIGGHLLWSTDAFGDLGIVASQAWEAYAATGFPEEHYQTRLLGAEWEYSKGRFSIASQIGRYLKSYSGTQSTFLSLDAYFAGSDNDWYMRTSTRRIGGRSFDLLEVYRDLQNAQRAVTIYTGISRDRLNSSTPGGYNSIYAGAYVDLFSTSRTDLSLWFELAKDEDDTLATLELNLTFGPGARTPYITAFGYSLDN